MSARLPAYHDTSHVKSALCSEKHTASSMPRYIPRRAIPKPTWNFLPDFTYKKGGIITKNSLTNKNHQKDNKIINKTLNENKS